MRTPFCPDCPPKMFKFIAELRKQLAAAEKDAERYRWLRDESNQTSEDSPCVSDASWGTFFGETLDAAIDAEIGAQL